MTFGFGQCLHFGWRREAECSRGTLLVHKHSVLFRLLLSGQHVYTQTTHKGQIH